MRIALCISGQSRNWKRCYQSWIDNIGHLGEIDIFYHFWDYNTLPAAAVSMIDDGILRHEPIHPLDICDMHDTLLPKKHSIEGHKIHTHDSVKNSIAWWTRDQFYSLKKAAMLKREYELENNFEYDLVFRLRADLLLETRIAEFTEIKPNTIYTCINSHDKKYKAFRVGDIFYFADSYTYDQVSDFYDVFNYIEATDIISAEFPDYPPELAFYFYMKSKGINNISNSIQCKIARSKEYAELKGFLDDYELL